MSTTAQQLPELDALADVLLTLEPDELAGFLLDQPPDQVELIERALADRLALGWRATPATFAHRLTGGDYKLWPYVSLLGECFRAAFDGDDAHQIWNLPSQYGKTTLLMWGVLWALDRNPALRLMYVSYDADKAVAEGGKARDLAEKHADELRFTLRPDARARGMWSTSEGGGLYCVGVYGGITGFPEDAVLCDDLLKGWVAAHSEAQRNDVWNVYRSQVRLRVQASTSPIIVVGTRWHEDDPTGRLLKMSEGDTVADQFSLVRLPALAEAPSKEFPEPDPLGRAVGEPLEPERFPLDEVLARHAGMGSYLTSAMEQQRPSPEEGGDIKRAWWRTYSQTPTRWDVALTSWDMKLKDKEAGDYVVGQAWCKVGGGYYLLDQLRGQWSESTARVAIALMSVRHPEITMHVVENTGYGPEVIEVLRSGIPGYELADEMIASLGIAEHERSDVEQMLRDGIGGILPENPKGQKRVRLRAVSPLIEARTVWVPEGALFADLLIEECAAFPNGAHDDMADALSQALKRLSKGGATFKAPRASGPLPSAGARSSMSRTTRSIGRPVLPLRRLGR